MEEIRRTTAEDINHGDLNTDIKEDQTKSALTRISFVVGKFIQSLVPEENSANSITVEIPRPSSISIADIDPDLARQEEQTVMSDSNILQAKTDEPPRKTDRNLLDRVAGFFIQKSNFPQPPKRG